MAHKFFNPFPRYLQIRNILLRRLQSELAPGDSFPTENALSEEFGVSRETIREALAELEKQGLIERVRGRGTRVKQRPKNSADKRVTGLVEDFTELKRDTWTRHLGTELLTAKPPIGDELQIPADEPLYLIRRLRFLDGSPLAVHEAYMPVEFGVPIARLDLSRTTVSNELQSYFNLELHEDYQTIDATVADPELAKLLEVAVGAPLLQVRRRQLDQKNRAIVFFVSWFRSDRYFATIKFPDPQRRKGGKSTEIGRRQTVTAASRTSRRTSPPD